MPAAFLVLVGAQLLGEVLRRVLHLPLPGPVIGMFLLAVALALRPPQRAGAEASPLARTAKTLIDNMGLLFVPAGVGIVAEAGVLKQAWLPLLVGLVVSTVLGLLTTGLIMHHLSRRREPQARPQLPPRPAQRAEGE